MAESFSKLGDSIYFRDEAGVYVNLFVPSELDWRERGIRLVLDSRFPEEDLLHLHVHSMRRTKMAVRIRVPFWSAGASAWLNGRPLAQRADPGSYLAIEREWSGDA
jgi:DUF1680 family protein